MVQERGFSQLPSLDPRSYQFAAGSCATLPLLLDDAVQLLFWAVRDCPNRLRLPNNDEPKVQQHAMRV